MLLRRHFAAIYRFFASKVDCAEDLAQKTFQACVESRDRIEGALRPYLFGVARNQLLMFFRGNGRYRRRFQPQEHSVAATMVSPSQVLAKQDDRRLLVAALQNLPLDFQITIELVYWEELSIAEVASITGVAAGTVKSRLHRARARLREELLLIQKNPGAVEQTLRSLDGWAREVREQRGSG